MSPKPTNSRRSNPRPVDTLVEETHKTLGSRLSLIANRTIKLWKALLIVVFVAGFASALVWALSIAPGGLSTGYTADPKVVIREGALLTQVDTKGAVTDTTEFFYDSTNDMIYIYTDPSGETLEIVVKTTKSLIFPSKSGILGNLW